MVAEKEEEEHWSFAAAVECLIQAFAAYQASVAYLSPVPLVASKNRRPTLRVRHPRRSFHLLSSHCFVVVVVAAAAAAAAGKEPRY